MRSCLVSILKGPKGVELAVLLRLRDWLAQELPAGDPKELLIEEVKGVLEFFDARAGVVRAVLVPRKDAPNFARAVGELVTRFKVAPEIAADPVSAAVQARAIYSRYLAGSRVGEEDFVTVLAAAGRGGNVTMRPIESLLPQLAKTSVLELDAVSQIEGIERLHKMLLGESPTKPAESGPGPELEKHASPPRISALLEQGLLAPGAKLIVRDHPGEVATRKDAKSVEYKGKRLSINDWAMQVTGWSAINVYAHVALEKTGETLDALRMRWQAVNSLARRRQRSARDHAAKHADVAGLGGRFFVTHRATHFPGFPTPLRC